MNDEKPSSGLQILIYRFVFIFYDYFTSKVERDIYEKIFDEVNENMLAGAYFGHGIVLISRLEIKYTSWKSTHDLGQE